MTRPQLLTIIAFLGLLILLLFGFRTKPHTLLQEEKTRLLNLSSTDISILEREARDLLSEDQKSRIQILESQLDLSRDSTERLDLLKRLSGAWYETRHFSMAGHYAEEVAKMDNLPESWGIAGTTYALGANLSTKEKEQQFCRDKAIENLEIAISENPSNIEFQINRAIVFAEHPSSENPMKGIQLLLGLNKNNPKNVSVINNLARFALQTGQLDRATERLNSALALDPENNSTHCLLVELYSKTGDSAKMNFHQEKCDQ